MTTALWLSLPAREVIIAELIATQPGLLLHALTGEPTSHSGDVLPHVIAWQGALYLEDGHHRAARALLAGQLRMTARVLDITG